MGQRLKEWCLGYGNCPVWLARVGSDPPPEYWCLLGHRQELCRSLASRWFPQWRSLAGGTQGQVFLAGPRQKSSVRQVLSHWLQVWGEDPRGTDWQELGRMGQSLHRRRWASGEVFRLSSVQQMLIDCLLCAGHWRKQRTDLGVNTNEETKVEFRPYGPGKYSGQKEVTPEHLRFTPKAWNTGSEEQKTNSRDWGLIGRAAKLSPSCLCHHWLRISGGA